MGFVRGECYAGAAFMRAELDELQQCRSMDSSGKRSRFPRSLTL